MGPGVITGRYGTIGKVFYQEDDFWPLNTTLWVSDFHGNDRRFIYYLLQCIDFATHSGKSGVPGLNRNDLHTEDVTLPTDLLEQAAIADALWAVDDLIAAVERQINKSQAISQGMMQHIVSGGSRLPGFARPWNTATLGDLCALRSGTPKARAAGGRYWVVDMGSVTREAEFVVTRMTNDSVGLLHPGELVMPKDDIGGGNIIGRTGLIDRRDSYVLADHVYALTPRDVDPAFLNYAINSRKVNAALRSKATGSAQLGLSRKSVLDQEIDYPSDVEEQRAIAHIMTDAGREVAALRARLRKVRAVKVGMMQELLTGRTRLPVKAAS